MNALRFALRSMLWWLNIAAASFRDFPGRCWNVRWGWKRQSGYQFDDLSCQLRSRDTGANEAKHGTAPVASGTDALESVGLVAGENVIGADARTMARRARGRVGDLRPFAMMYPPATCTLCLLAVAIPLSVPSR